MHFTLNLTVEDMTITGEGDGKFTSGKLQAIDLTEEGGGPVGKLRLLVVDQSTYVQPPAHLNQSGKPWILVRRDSGIPAVRNLAMSMEQLRDLASLDQFTTFTTAARRVTLVGSESVDGAPVTHYSIEMDITKFPANRPVQPLIDAGVTTLPLELYVDSEGRPVRLTEDVTVQAHHISTVITLGHFNAPVSINAPPADQVGTS